MKIRLLTAVLLVPLAALGLDVLPGDPVGATHAWCLNEQGEEEFDGNLHIPEFRPAGVPLPFTITVIPEHENTLNVWGTEGHDIIIGANGRELICGNGGNDILIGRGGNDVLRGGDGDDALYGEAGNDYLDGASGNDVGFGGDGDDECVNVENPGCDL